MTQVLWTAVDNYVSSLLAPHEQALQDALAASAQNGLPEIQVSPTQGKLLHVLARMVNARNILEIGTLAATAPSGWPERFPLVDACCHWSSVPSTLKWPAPISPAPDSAT